MTIQLIQGEFSAAESLELIAEMIRVKINFHESKINKLSSEEDTKRREVKIKELQRDLDFIRAYIEANGDRFSIQAAIKVG
jgi:hypothetical protein